MGRMIFTYCHSLTVFCFDAGDSNCDTIARSNLLVKDLCHVAVYIDVSLRSFFDI